MAGPKLHCPFVRINLFLGKLNIEIDSCWVAVIVYNLRGSSSLIAIALIAKWDFWLSVKVKVEIIIISTCGTARLRLSAWLIVVGIGAPVFVLTAETLNPFFLGDVCPTFSAPISAAMSFSTDVLRAGGVPEIASGRTSCCK